MTENSFQTDLLCHPNLFLKTISWVFLYNNTPAWITVYLCVREEKKKNKQIYHSISMTYQRTFVRIIIVELRKI